MKSLGLLRKAQLAFMTLLTMVIGMACARNAPRYEPEPLTVQEDIEINMHRSDYREDSIQKTDSHAKSYSLFWKKFCEYFDKANHLNDVKNLLDDIRYDESKNCTLYVESPATGQNDFNGLINTNIDNGKDAYGRPICNILPNTFSIFFTRKQDDGYWSNRKLVGTESITIRSNSILPNSENYSLIAFVISIQEGEGEESMLIPFVKLDQEWYYYNNSNERENHCTTQQAIDLASRHGNIFFYKKSNK